MRRFIARACPGSEILGLLFGATVAVAINLLTALALHSVSNAMYNKVAAAGWLLLTGSAVIGVLAVLVGQKRSDVLDGVGGTVSTAERRAMYLQELERSAAAVGVLGVSWIASVIAAMIVLTL